MFMILLLISHTIYFSLPSKTILKKAVSSIVALSALLFIPVTIAVEFPLHECIFNHDSKKLAVLLESPDVSVDKKDKHGNTALHLAVMMGKTEHIQLLLEHNALVSVKNVAGWTALSEAISYGNRETILAIWKRNKQQLREATKKLRSKLVSGLNKIPDFYMEMKWDFHSWIPLVSRLLPSDVCKIRKYGSLIRIDTTLIDFGDDFRWKRGDISLLIDTEALSKEAFILMNNDKREYQRIKRDENRKKGEKMVDLLMSDENVNLEMSTKSLTFVKAKSGFIFKRDKKKMVGRYEAQEYIVDGIILSRYKRREHLSNEDLQRIKDEKKALKSLIKKGDIPDDTDDYYDNHEYEQTKTRKSLPPPLPCTISWKQYIESESGKHPNLGRPMVIKETSRSFKASVSMSEEYPISIEMLSDLLEAASSKLPRHLKKLNTFIQLKLPHGFPVELDIPLVLTLSARIRFQEFQILKEVDGDDFRIPSNYKEVQDFLDIEGLWQQM